MKMLKNVVVRPGVKSLTFEDSESAHWQEAFCLLSNLSSAEIDHIEISRIRLKVC